MFGTGGISKGSFGGRQDMEDARKGNYDAVAKSVHGREASFSGQETAAGLKQPWKLQKAAWRFVADFGSIDGGGYRTWEAGNMVSTG